MKIKNTVISVLAMALFLPTLSVNAEVGGTITRSIKPEVTSQKMENQFVTGFIQKIDKENKKLHMIGKNEEFYYVNIDEKSDIEFSLKAGDFIEVESHPYMTLIYPPEYYAIKIEKAESFATLKKDDGIYVIESAFGLSHNEFGQYTHLKETLDRKYTDKVEQIIYKLDTKFGKTLPQVRAKIFEELADEADERIIKIIMKYPQDSSMSKKDTLKYSVYTYFKYKLEIKAYKLKETK